MGSEGILTHLSDKDYNELFELMSVTDSSSSKEKRIKEIFNVARRGETRHRVRAQGRGDIISPVEAKNASSAYSVKKAHSAYRSSVRGSQSKQALHDAAVMYLDKLVSKSKPASKSVAKPASKPVAKSLPTKTRRLFKANTKRGYVTPAPTNTTRGLSSTDLSKKWWISHFGKPKA